MSLDYKEEINKLVIIQKQQSYNRQNHHVHNIIPQLQNQQQIITNIPQQLNTTNSEQNNNIQFLLQGNKTQVSVKQEKPQYIPKGTRPKIQSLKKTVQIPNTNSQIYYQTDPNDLNALNNSFIGTQQNSLFSMNSKNISKEKSYLVKDILEFQSRQNPENDEAAANIQNNDLNNEDELNNQQQEEEQYKQQDQQKQNDNNNVIQQKGYQQKQQNYVNKSLNQSPLKEIMIQDQSVSQERGNASGNLKEYGVDEIQIKGGGGGMLKRKKKYEYRFRDLNELVQESESKAPYWMIDMRHTPRLYEKKMKLQTINEWKNQRMISCEEDQMAKQDLIMAKVQNKKRLEEQIDSISKQQFQWEYIVAQQLQKFKVRNQNNSVGNGLSEFKNCIFQNDFDKRIHNLYINEKLLKFSAEKQSIEQQMILHQNQLEKERDRIRTQELRQSRDKSRQRTTINLSNFNSIDSPERLNSSQYDGFNYKINQSSMITNQFGDTFLNQESQRNVKIEDQSNLKNSMNENLKQNEQINPSESPIIRQLLNSSQQSFRLRESTELNPDDQVKNLYNYFENNKTKQEPLIQNADHLQINFTTSDCKAKESVEAYLKNQISLTKSRFPTIQRSTSRDNKQKIIFSLSEKKQKQHDLSPIQNKSFSKKSSIDHHTQRYYIHNNQRYPSPQINYNNYNVQIDYPNNNKSFFQHQIRHKSNHRKGFLNQTYVKF